MMETRKTIKIFKSHCEGADCYHTVIIRSAKYRVIVCKDNHQWILQRRAGFRHGAPRWDSVSYCRDREVLIRLWTGLHRDGPPSVCHGLLALPPKFRGDR